MNDQENMLFELIKELGRKMDSYQAETLEIMRDTEQGIFAIKDGLEERIDNRIEALRKEKNQDIEKVHNRISSLKGEVDDIRSKPYKAFETYKGVAIIAIITAVINAFMNYGAKIWALITKN